MILKNERTNILIEVNSQAFPNVTYHDFNHYILFMQDTNVILNILNERIIFENHGNMNILEFLEFIPNPMALQSVIIIQCTYLPQSLSSASKTHV